MKFLNEAVKFIPPLKNFNSIRINSNFGAKRKTGIHKGTDFAVSSGTKLYAIADGVIDFATDDLGYCGGRIDVKHTNTSLLSRYCHVRKFVVRDGQSVKKGQLLGYSGGGENDPYKGRSTGAHLHFAVLKNNYPIDPMSLINKSSNDEYFDTGASTSTGTNNISSDFGITPIDSTSGSFAINPIDSTSNNFSISPIDSTSNNFSISPIASTSGNFKLKNENLNKEINRIKILLK